jgi:hypothetical protein
MPKFDDKQWAGLVDALRREVAALAPGWTDHDSSDPGINLIELFAFLTEELACRSSRFDERGKAAVERLLRAAQVLEASTAREPECGLRRVNYFFGQVLSVDDLNAEQEYFRSRSSRLNRALYGAGIVTGLDVSIEPGACGGTVHVRPGLALDSSGNEIEVCAPASIALPTKGKTLFVLIRYRERLCDPVPTLDATDEPARASRIAESFELSLEPVQADPWLALGRLRLGQKRWKAIRGFEPRRVKR